MKRKLINSYIVEGEIHWLEGGKAKIVSKGKEKDSWGCDIDVALEIDIVPREGIVDKLHKFGHQDMIRALGQIKNTEEGGHYMWLEHIEQPGEDV